MAFSDDDDKVVWKDWAEDEIRKRDKRIRELEEAAAAPALQVDGLELGLIQALVLDAMEDRSLPPDPITEPIMRNLAAKVSALMARLGGKPS